MTRSLLVLAKIFSSGAVLLQNRPFLTPGLQPPDDTMARRSALRSSTHQKVWEIGYQPGFGHTRAAKGTIPLLVTGSKEKTPWETVPWQTWKRDLDNYSLVWCLSAKQQNYSPPAHSCSNGLFFFFPWSAEFRRSQPAHEPCWCKREKAQAESNGIHPSMQMLLL